MLSNRVIMAGNARITAFTKLSDPSSTLTGRNFGTANGARSIVAVVHAPVSNDASAVLSSATIGGVSATILAQINSGSGPGDPYVGIIAAKVPSGTSGDISLTWASGSPTAHVSLYRAIGGDLLTALDTATTTHTSGVSTLNLNTVAGGAALAAVACQNASTTTWVGVTESYDADTGSGEYVSAGLAYPPGGGTPQTVTATNADSSPSGIAAVSVSWS